MSDDTAKIVSASWTNGCEAYVGQSLQNSENTLFQAAAAEGQSIFVAIGRPGSRGLQHQRRDRGDRPARTRSRRRSIRRPATLYVANKSEQHPQCRQRGEHEQPRQLRDRGLGVTPGSGPDAVALDAPDGKVFVANADSTLTVILDGTCNQTDDEWLQLADARSPRAAISAPPTALAVSGSTLYVANSNGTVAVYNATTNTFVTTVTLPRSVGADGAGRRQHQRLRVRRRRRQQQGRVLQRRDVQRHHDQRDARPRRSPSPSATIPSPWPSPNVAGDLYVANAGGGGGISVVSLSSQTVVNDHFDHPARQRHRRGQSIGLSPDGNEVLAVLNGFAFPGDVMATIDTTTKPSPRRSPSRPGTDPWASS